MLSGRAQELVQNAALYDADPSDYVNDSAFVHGSLCISLHFACEASGSIRAYGRFPPYCIDHALSRTAKVPSKNAAWGPGSLSGCASMMTLPHQIYQRAAETRARLDSMQAISGVEHRFHTYRTGHIRSRCEYPSLYNMVEQFRKLRRQKWTSLSRPDMLPSRPFFRA